ncbi:ABC transporter ATP-binding protein [Alienimonas californiensis]|uniref:Putative ABC transporter ATP-binding protein YxlF n=1 Tax=Alienimonas californiensis TaxID=2527989 RepID=A0A517PEL0_9PLAN|nr:ABC transporter ATP-binding protein [Alienimonas californiensis]QDT17798.1 putative ABC transporter ATP-binding protein YxlF [Alienimonas californiensis]
MTTPEPPADLAFDDPPACPQPPAPRGSGEPVVDATGLTKTYRDGWFGRTKVHALRGVSFRVERGEIFGLLGPNGAGKTTLIKVLLGICRKSGGTATVLGCPAGAREARCRIGYLPEGHRLPRHLTANTALDYYGGLSGLSGADVKRRRGDLLRLVGLSKWGDTNVRKFSKGMQQRLGLAQAMLHDPDLLILDEPTDGVDPVGRADIRKVLGELKARGKTVFLNSHLLQELEMVCDRAAILRNGEVRGIGNMDELRGGGEQISLRVLGAEKAVRAALVGARLGDVPLRPLGADADGRGRFTVELAEADQPRIDAAVDALRAAGVSLHSLVRTKPSLEDAFLRAVADDPTADGVRQAGGVTE